MMKALTRRLLQEPHGVTSQKTAFFIVTAVETLKLTRYFLGGNMFKLTEKRRLKKIYGGHEIGFTVEAGKLICMFSKLVVYNSRMYMC
jgi:hypothetical protein